MREGRVVIALRGIVNCTTGRPARVERRIMHSLTGLAVRGAAHHTGSTGDWLHGIGRGVPHAVAELFRPLATCGLLRATLVVRAKKSRAGAERTLPPRRTTRAVLSCRNSWHP